MDRIALDESVRERRLFDLEWEDRDVDSFVDILPEASHVQGSRRISA